MVSVIAIVSAAAVSTMTVWLAAPKAAVTKVETVPD